MALSLPVDPVPFYENEDGTWLINASRIPIDTVVRAFKNGATPEEIAQQFPVLSLATIYAVIAYYLNEGCA